MKICGKCGWENQDEFNFCLGCGSQLGSASKAEPLKPVPAVSVTPAPVSTLAIKTVEDVVRPAMLPEMRGSHSSATGTSPSSERGMATKECTVCQAVIPPGHAFCGQCGARYVVPEPVVPVVNTQPPASPATSVPMSPVPVSAASSAEAPARLVLLLPNGEEGGSYPLKGDVTEIGRRQGNILFLDDPYVSPLHAVFYHDKGQLRVRNKDSFNGLFIRLRKRVTLGHSDVILLGKQLLRFEQLHVDAENAPAPDQTVPVWGSPYNSYWGRLIQLISGGYQGNAILLGGEHVELGRERGQITFPGDRFISSLHAKISFENQQFYLEDVGSRNGTFVQIREEAHLSHKDILIIGEQLLRVEINI